MAQPSDSAAASLREAEFPEDAGCLRALFRRYRSWLGLDLCFQGFDEELADLPGHYARPRGNAWLAWRNGEAVGCVAVRPLEDAGACEMKRLYVSETARGHGLGGRLAQRSVAWAVEAGYRIMRLDTLQSMAVARGIYGRLGFTEIPAYRRNSLDRVVSLELDLALWSGRPGALEAQVSRDDRRGNQGLA